MSRYPVVVLNWNSWSDTIQCLESIIAGDGAALPVVLDNGSTNDSVDVLTRWCGERGLEVHTLTTAQCASAPPPPASVRVVLLRSPENLGFARGSNIGVMCAARWGFPEMVLLNNDTIVAPGALSVLVRTLREEPGVFATLPLIRVHGTTKVWNCGGRISRLGFRHYHFAGAELGSLPIPDRIECSFFTGCCFAVRTHDFAERGGFTERFFFGEEDFELGLWMLDTGKSAICITAARIDHKVSATAARLAKGSSRRAYVHYLNRFIHMRIRLGLAGWLLWSAIYLPYVALVVGRNSGIPRSEVPRFVRALMVDARRHDGIDRDLFVQLMGADRW